MPIRRINRVPFPTDMSPEPRASVISPVPGAQREAAGRGVQAATLGFQDALQLGETAQGFLGLSRELLKPLDDLRKSKEVLDANVIGIRAILSARQVAATARTDGTPNEKYVQAVASAFDRIEQQALTSTKALGPAATEHVAGMLQAERLSLFSSSQQFVIQREGARQVGELAESDLYYRQEMAKTMDPAKRADITTAYNAVYDRAAQSNLIDPKDAALRKEDFKYTTYENTAIVIGRAKGVLAARDYLRSVGLDPVRQAAFENKVIDDLSYDDQRHRVLEAKTQKELEAARTITRGRLNAKFLDKGTTVEALRDYIKLAPAMAENGDINPNDVVPIQEAAQRQIDELLKPVKLVDNEAVKNDFLVRMALAPETVTPDEYMGATQVTSDTKVFLNNYHRGQLNPKHFSHHPLFTSSVKRLEAYRNQTVPYEQTANGDQLLAINALVEGYVAEYVTMAYNLAAPTQGVLTDTQLLELNKEVLTFEEAIKQRKWPKSTPASKFYGGR